MPYYFRPELC
jgi:hypothetical protein